MTKQCQCNPCTCAPKCECGSKAGRRTRGPSCGCGPNGNCGM